LLAAWGGGEYPWGLGGILLIAMVVMAVNLVVDLLYGLINPRVRAR
jgi:dipeptide transport system permease protein